MKIKGNLSREEIISKIMEKKEFSKLPKEDVELVLNSFDKRDLILEDKIKLTRDLLRKMYSVFVSDKLLNKKNESPEWFLKKHISTRERFDYYPELYSRILNKNETIFDLGSGVNGFSFEYFPKGTKYVGVEAVGQLVDLMNHYFKIKKLGGKVFHGSLFDLEKMEKLLKQGKGHHRCTLKDFEKKSLPWAKVIFLFKVLDSLEMLKKDYSKTLLLRIAPLVDRIAISYATESLVSHKKFFSNRKWLRDFISANFKVLDEFKLGNENYVLFSKR